MTTAYDIMHRVSLMLQDEEFTRWTKKEMLDWINEAQVAIARTPGAFSKTKIVELEEGTQQTLPEDAWALISVTRNFDEDGCPLLPVRLVTRTLLDAAMPTWHMAAPKPLVENYVYDERTPKTFFVYPPSDGDSRVEVMYMAIPKRLESETDPLELDDTFVPAITSYVMHRAVSKESDYASGLQSAAAFYQSYLAERNEGLEARVGVSPNVSPTQEGGAE